MGRALHDLLSELDDLLRGTPDKLEEAGKGDADAPMRWEYSSSFSKSRWIPYDQDNNDKIQAAYQKYQDDASRHNREIVITVQRRYKYTINFKYMNSTSHGPNKDRTDIRRVARAVLMTPGRVVGCWYQQTWIGSFSAVSKPNFASKY